MLGTGGKGKKGKGDKKGKGKGTRKKGESNKDEKDKYKDKKGKGEGKNNMKKDCWLNENAKSGEDTASLETPITPAESTKTEPPITGILIKAYEGGEILADDAQWMYAVTRQESVPNTNDIVMTAEFGRQPGWKTQRTWSGARVSHRTSIHDDW